MSGKIVMEIQIIFLDFHIAIANIRYIAEAATGGVL